MNSQDYSYQKNGNVLRARLIPWDTKVFGFSCAEIYDLEFSQNGGGSFPQSFYEWINEHAVKLMSCRLSVSDMQSGFLLEKEGFNFIEVNLHPIIDLTSYDFVDFEDIEYELADNSELNQIKEIANRSFSNERFHLDPRLPDDAANQRYANWVMNAAKDTKQDVYVIRSKMMNSIVGFFITSEADGRSYWHLTAIDSQFHSRGLGFKSWSSILSQLKSRGIRQVSTTISSKNFKVLSLYSRLSFRFGEPSKTYHWVC